MFGIFLSALFSIVGWIFRSVLIKFFVMFALFFVASAFMAYLAPKLPGAGSITSAFAAIPSGVWWVLDLFMVPLGLKLVLTGYVTRFAIRRMPIIG
jgi:hypothetical protein